MPIRLIAVAAFTLAIATSAQAMTLVPLHQPDGVLTQVREACGAGRVRINGVCVARTTIRPAGVRDGVEAIAFTGTETLELPREQALQGIGSPYKRSLIGGSHDHTCCYH